VTIKRKRGSRSKNIADTVSGYNSRSNFINDCPHCGNVRIRIIDDSGMYVYDLTKNEYLAVVMSGKSKINKMMCGKCLYEILSEQDRKLLNKNEFLV
jgi:hypothetical protein